MPKQICLFAYNFTHFGVIWDTQVSYIGRELIPSLGLRVKVNSCFLQVVSVLCSLASSKCSVLSSAAVSPASTFMEAPKDDQRSLASHHSPGRGLEPGVLLLVRPPAFRKSPTLCWFWRGWSRGVNILTPGKTGTPERAPQTPGHSGWG